jgi:hypothetical protein
MGVVVFPDEDEPPLRVDPDAVKIPQVTGQFFKAVAGRNSEVIQLGRRMKLVELNLGAGLDIAGQFFAAGFEAEYLPSIDIGDALNRESQIT